VIKNLIILKRFEYRLLHKFPQKCWNESGLDVLLGRRSEAVVNFCLGWV